MSLSPAVQLFEAHTCHFLAPQQPDHLRLANDYFMSLKRDRAGLEVVLQVIGSSVRATSLFLACNILLDFLSE